MQHSAATAVRWLLVVGVCALLGFGLAGPARAHAELQSSSPSDGASLKRAPKVVQLVFGETLLSGGAAVTATEVVTKQRLDLPKPELNGNELSVSWPAAAPAGQYRVAFRVVSADGHPITGSIGFTYRRARSEAGAGSATTSVSPVPILDDSASRSHPADALGPTPPKDPISSPALAAAFGLGVVALLAMGFGMWHTTRRR